jgi:hypothetical protein
MSAFGTINETTPMGLTTKAKREMLRTCDEAFETHPESYKVEKTDFMKLIKILLNSNGVIDTQTGRRIWNEYES